MTSKDYLATGLILKYHKAGNHLVASFIDLFKKDNVKFNKDKFIIFINENSNR